MTSSIGLRLTPGSSTAPCRLAVRILAASDRRLGNHVRARLYERPGATSWVTTAPAPVSAPSPSSTGATRRRVDARVHAVADLGAVLVHAVVVRGDRARAEVRAGADVGVADVGEVRHLGALADLGVLGLDERADLHARRRGGCRAARYANGPTAQSSPISHFARDGVRHAHVLADHDVGQMAVRSDDRAGADHRAALEHRARAAAARRARARPSRRCRCAAGRPS